MPIYDAISTKRIKKLSIIFALLEETICINSIMGASEKMYVEMFPLKTGNSALSVRVALGSLIIKQRKKLFDRALVKEIQESPYLQYFIGFPDFQKEEPFTAPVRVYFRKRIDVTVFIDAIERYYERTGHYPKRVLVDKIYRTRDNLRFCKDKHIEISGPNLGRPAGGKPKVSKDEKQDEKDRIEVERFFSLDKRCNGAGLIMTKLSDTTLNTIAMTVLITNLFATATNTFFVLYFMDCVNGLKQQYYIEIEPAV